MILYRIAKCNYADDLSGNGARLYGGRWNSEGKPMLYMASSRALAVLEVLVHLPPMMIPENYCLAEIEVPEDVVDLDLKQLPASWQNSAVPVLLREIGDSFLKTQQHLMMCVPSTIVPAESNYLLNPLHPEFKKVKLLKKERFDFDERLL